MIKHNIPLFKTILVFLFVGLSEIAYSGPTQNHLNLNPIEKITEALEPELVQNVPWLLEISSKETDDTFFGYHAMSQNNRLFQDILHAVFEEVLLIPIPENFYFFRIPGEPMWDWSNGKNSFINHYSNLSVPKEYTDLVVANFLLIVQKGLGYHFKMEELTDIDHEILWTYFQDHIDYMQKYRWASTVKKYSMPVGYEWEEPILNKNLSSVVSLIIRKAQCQDSKEDPIKIREWFEKTFADSYDISIALKLRELNLDDKQRIGREIEKLSEPFDDTEAPQNAMLVSLNTSIFGNYQNSGCFTPEIFFENKTILDGDSCLEKLLEEFFDDIGLDPFLARQMWSRGQKRLFERGFNHGCLLQLFDESALLDEKPLSLLDQNAFLAFKHGIPVKDLTPSKYVQGYYQLEKNYKDLELRLVMNNQTILNPFSTIRMIRYEGLFSQNNKDLVIEMKHFLKDVPRDELKTIAYLRHLERLWKVPQVPVSAGYETEKKAM